MLRRGGLCVLQVHFLAFFLHLSLIQRDSQIVIRATHYVCRVILTWTRVTSNAVFGQGPGWGQDGAHCLENIKGLSPFE